MTRLNATLNVTLHTLSHFTFDTIDYVVFVLMLAVSLGIGIYFGFFGHGADNTEEYLLGGKRMKTIPIAISLIASQLSALTIMAIPSEVYSFGVNWYFNVLAMVMVVPILCWCVIPIFYENNISNCYEYLDKRFNRQIRHLLTFGFMGMLFAMLPLFIFVPSLAFSQVTQLNIHVINASVCTICVVYTMLGGIKAVVWTDVVQALIMLASMIIVGVLGTTRVGGFSEVFRIARENGRLDVDYSFDATSRFTIWNGLINATVFWVAYVGLNQSCVQRILALPTLKQARRALIIFGIGFILIMSIQFLTGVIMYARYHNCDPVKAGFVQKSDKMVPYFVQDIVGHLKGMPGVFISCIFSAALSTMSACLNSLAGVIYFDYIKPHVQHTEQGANYIMKIIICVLGVYCIFGGVLVELFGSILQMLHTITGVTMGSVCGVFLLGMLMPRAHGRAALWSVIVSMVCMFSIVLGSQGRLRYQPLPVSVEDCPAGNYTQHFSITNTTTPATAATATSFNILDLSFNWYVLVGALIVFIFAIPLSYVMPPGKDNEYEPRLVLPIVRSFVRYERARTHEEMTTLALKRNYLNNYNYE